VTNNVTVLGPGPVNLAVDGNTTNGVFHIGKGITVSISSLTITNGSGGIYNDHSTLSVSNCAISGNTVANVLEGGGGIVNDAVLGNAALTVIGSTLSGNFGGNAGGGILNAGNGGSAILTVIASTFSGNSANNGGGIFNNGNGGSAMLTITASTFSGNSTDYEGGGIYNQDLGATVKLSACTFSGNSAGLANHAIYISCGTLEIGGTILDAGSIIVSGCGGGVISDGFNLSSDEVGGDDHSTGPGGLLNATGDIRNTDAMLGPLADNGGLTLTHALLPGSPATDHGKSFGAATDQRGFPRSVEDPCVANASGGDGSDIGAFEVQQKCRPVAFRVTAIKRIWSGDDLRLSYTTVLASNYVVQARSNLVSGSWASLPGTNVGIGVAMQSIVTNAIAAPQGYYRIQQLP